MYTWKPGSYELTQNVSTIYIIYLFGFKIVFNLRSLCYARIATIKRADLQTTSKLIACLITDEISRRF